MSVFVDVSSNHPRLPVRHWPEGVQPDVPAQRHSPADRDRRRQRHADVHTEGVQPPVRQRPQRKQQGRLATGVQSHCPARGQPVCGTSVQQVRPVFKEQNKNTKSTTFI